MKKMLKHSLIMALCLSLLFCAVCRAEVFEDSQSLSLAGVGNARELGGYKTEDGRMVKRGVLLRTAKLATATEEDIERLLSVYRLAVDVDFLSSDVGKAGYGEFFRALLALNEGQAILFHCSQGKDRTGCGAMLISSPWARTRKPSCGISC